MASCDRLSAAMTPPPAPDRAVWVRAADADVRMSMILDDGTEVPIPAGAPLHAGQNVLITFPLDALRPD